MKRKIIFFMVLAMLAPVILSAQVDRVGDLATKHNDFSISAFFPNMSPVNNYVSQHYGSFGDNLWLFNYSQKNQVDEKTFWGLKFSTTLTGLSVLDPNFLKRDISLGSSNKAELSVTMVQFTTEYQLFKFGPLSVDAGFGMGIGGARLTLIGGENSCRFWCVSSLLSPQVNIQYHLFEGSGMGAILWFNTSYYYMPPGDWNADGGSPNIVRPELFNLSGLVLEVGVSFPFAATN